MMPRKKNPPKWCLACGKLMERKIYNGILESNHSFNRRKYCNLQCAGQGNRKENPTLSAIYKRNSNLVGDACENCGVSENLDLHHKDGDPTNNDMENAMTLCDSCHTAWHWENGKEPPQKRSVCYVCGSPGKGLGLCLKHYQRQKKYGSPYLTKIKQGSHYILVDERNFPQGWTEIGPQDGGPRREAVKPKEGQ